MSKESVDKELKVLTKLFTEGFEAHSKQFSFKDINDMQKLANWMIDMVFLCVKEKISPKVVFAIFKIMSEYTRVVFEESEKHES